MRGLQLHPWGGACQEGGPILGRGEQEVWQVFKGLYPGLSTRMQVVVRLQKKMLVVGVLLSENIGQQDLEKQS